MAGGDFSNTDFAAAAPFTYNHATGGGAYNNRTVGDLNDITEQLEGAQFAFGDIVTYLVQIELDGTTSAPAQVAEFDFSFLADSTGQSGAAQVDIVNVAINYGDVENGDDGTGSNPGLGFFGLDSGISDDKQGDASLDQNGIIGSTATLVNEYFVGTPFTQAAELRGTVRIDDLEASEKIVLRIDVLLAGQPGTNPTGNLQGQLNAGRVVAEWDAATGQYVDLATPDTINTGEQTIPFLRVGDIEGAGTPLLNIEKTVTTQGGSFDSGVEELTVTAGDTVRYYYEVTNDGTAELLDLSWIDDNGTPANTADDFTLDDATVLKVIDFNGNEFTSGFGSLYGDIDGEADANDLASGATVIFYKDVTLSTNGTVTNTADASGNNGLSGGNFEELTDSDTATVIVEGVPDFTITKTADVESVNAADQVITYTYTVSNTGDVPLTGVSLGDDNFTPADTSDDFNPTLSTNGNGDNVLDVGESWTYTASYTTTQADIDSGADLVNVANADTDQTQPKTDNETVDVVQNSNFSIVKEADVSEVDGAGDVINYTYTVTNTGNVSLTNVSLIDDNFTAGDTSDDFIPTFDTTSDNGNGVLDVGETWEYTASHTVTQTDIDNGDDLVNVATADTDQTQPKTDDETVDVVQNPNFSIVKEADVTSVDGAGDVINYTYTVTNTGNQTLTNVSLIDDNFTAGDTSDDFNPTFDTTSDDGNGVLDVGETWEYTASHTVTQTEIDNGADLVNVATADSDETAPKTDNETVDVVQNPNFSIVKEADVTSVDGAGDVINYTYTVTNTGNQTLTNVSLIDDNFTAGDTSDDFNPTFDTTSDDGNGVLDVGETWEYTASHTVTQTEIDNGADLVNVATADSDETAPKTDNETVDVVQNPNFSIVKEADVTSVNGAGDVINYTYTVTNTGNQTLTNVSLIDDNFTAGDTSDDFNPTFDTTSDDGNGVLDVGETWEYTASHTVTQTEIDNGADLVNVATADSDETAPKTDNETVDVVQNPNFSIVKEADVTSVNGAGDVINYTYTVTNTGNQTLTNVSLIDDNFTPGNTSDDFTPSFDSSSDDGNGVLDVGETWEYTASYTATQTDIDSGADLVNVATADSDETAPKTDNETVDVVQNPNLSIVKNADVTTVSAVGDVINYTYTVTNTGNQTLTNVSLSDDNFTPSDISDDFNPTFDTTSDDGNGVLDVGETWEYTASYTATQTDIDSGADLVNVATADSDETDPKTDDAKVDVVQDADFLLLKEADVSEVDAAGDVINYTYTVTNTGNQTLTNVSLIDDNFTPSDTSDDFNPTFDSSSDDGNGVLDVGETWEYTASHTVTQTEIDSGADLVNVATADSDETTPKTDNETVDVVQNPNFSIVKEADVTSVDGAGDVINYTYTVTNTGNVSLTNVSLIDDNFTAGDTSDDFNPTFDSSSDDGNGVLDVGETWEYTASYTATQTDIDSGADLVNVATADSDETAPKTDNETVDVVQNPNFSIVKEADVSEVDGAGDVINYTYTVTNTGNQTLTNVSLIDDNFTPADTSDDFNPTFDTTSDNGNGVLDVGETWEYTASHTVTQTEIDSGADLVNVATADSDETAPKTDNETVDVVQNPNFSIVKEADVTSVDGAGDVINYTYTVTNTGNVSLTNVSLIDDNFTPSDTSDDFNPTFDTTSDDGNGVLDVGETWEYTASHTVTQTEIDNGADLVNVATADSDETAPKTDDETVDVVQNPNFSIVKEADVSEVDGAGDVINYTYTVTNTGNQTLTNVSLIDDNFTAGDTSDDFNPTFDTTSDDGNGVLDVGETWEYTASHTVTQTEIDSGADLVNVATADSDETAPKTDDETVDVVQNPNFSIVKEADVSEVDGAGDVINYTYTVTNTGNQTLTNVSLIDDNFTAGDTSDDFNPTFDSSSDNGNGVLDVGETWEYTASHTVTQTDIDNGDDLVNVATADSDETQPKTDDETVDVVQNPNLSIFKEADVTTVSAAGDVINYTYTVTNTGNQTLTNVSLSDDNFTPSDTSDDFTPTFDTTSDDGNGVLDVGETWEYTASHTVTQTEIDKGTQLVNVAKADSDQTEPEDDSEQVQVFQDPNLSIVKDADVTSVDGAGDVINYTYTVTNTGNVSLTNVSLIDDNFTPSDTSDDFTPTFDTTSDDGNGVLDVGETWEYTASYTATQTDIDSGVDLVNVATADSDETDPKTDDETVDVVQNPNLSIVKDADVTTVDDAGDVINYTYTVTNTGNQTLTNVSLIDDNFTPADTSDDFNPTFDTTSDDGNGVLDVGETWEYTASYTATQADIDSGADLVNIATADSDQTQPKTDDEKVTITQNPNLDISKTADVSQVDAVGDVINYTYTLTNTGNVSLSDVTLSDDNFTPANTGDDFSPTLSSNGNGDNILDVGETWEYTASYTVTQADIDSGADLVNVATVDTEQTDPKTDDEKVDVIQEADFLLLKDADVTQVDADGDVINYTYTLTNTGNVSLTGITLSDDNFTPANTSDDFSPVLSTNGNGDNILDVGETWTYTASYTATQADIDNGADLVNVATADTDQTDPKTDNETVDVIQRPNLSIIKDADVSEVDAAGNIINYTYTVTNTGNQTLTNVSLSDDNFTPADTSDDFNPTFDSTSDDGNGVLDVGETWEYTASYTVTQADIDSGVNLVNVATADTDETDPKTDDETVNVLQIPSITIDKVTSDGVVTGDNIGVSAGQSITWTYTVTNDGNLNLSNINLSDDQQGAITNLVDNGDGDSILAPDETWVYEASGTAIFGDYQNIGTVTGDYTDDGETKSVTDADPSSYTGIAAPGVRTPGFWINWTEVWDGDASNDSRFAGRSGFPGSDILLAPYSASAEAPEVIDPVSGQYSKGILVGDYNRDGITNNGENTIFYSLNEAKSILSASKKVEKNDKRYTLDRSLIASWLNNLAFNPAPIDDINNGIAWIQEHTPDENGDGVGDGNLILGASTYAVPASSDFWNEEDLVAGLPSGNSIHTALDNYNNFGI
jgi:uncharacterized repeat protein (TIGR01451 family)